MNKFADWLRQSVDARGITVGQLAEYTGIRASTLSLLVRGVTRPRYESVLKLARYFHEQPGRILEMAGYEEVEPSRVPAIDLANPRLRLCFTRAAELPAEDQAQIADLIGPIIDREFEFSREDNRRRRNTKSSPNKP